MEPLKRLLLENELWLMQRILHYSKVHGYVKYTSTLLEAWRISIASLSATLAAAIDRYASAPEFGPDDDYARDSIAAFGVEEGMKHRSRGLSLGMYLSLFKYYRQSYLDLLDISELDGRQHAQYRYFLDRCFDCIEIGLTSAWALSSEGDRLNELQTTNRYLANEKNKYLTIFESLHDPVILLDSAGQISNMNYAAAVLFGRASHPGDMYYGEASGARPPAWLGALLTQFAAAGVARLELEQAIATSQGPRHFLVKVERMLDVSEKFIGIVVLLNDLTARKEAEERLRARSEELSTLYDVTAIVTTPAPLDTVLDQALDRVLATVKGQGGGIRLLEPGTGELRLVAEKVDPLSTAACAPDCTALAAWVVVHDTPLVISDLHADPRVPAGQCGEHTFVAMPMRAGGRIQGVLSIFRAHGHVFELAEVSLLSSVAEGLALAVENSRRSRLAAIIEERERLARELHDSVTQSLYSLSLFSEWSAGLLDAGETAAAREKQLRIAEIARQALKEMRLMVFELRSSELETGGLRGALEMRLLAVEERAGVQTSLDFDPALHLPGAVEDEFYHIAQEALNNALKHAMAQTVTVRVGVEGAAVRLAICDDGCGFDLAGAEQSGGMGITSMRARAARVGGAFQVTSAPGCGCTVSVALAMPAATGTGTTGVMAHAR